MSERADVSQPSRVFSPAARRSGVWAKRMSAAGRLLLHAVLLITGFLTILPFLWMLSTSLKSEGTVFIYPPKWIPDPIVWENYLEAWTFLPMGQAYVNSLKIGLIVTAGSLFTSTLAGYTFAKLQFPGRNVLFVLLLATMMIPGQVTLVPSYILYSYIGWIDTHLPLIVPPALGGAFGVFLMRQYYMTIPADLEDAARIDGCNPWQTYLRIMVPLSGPPVSALAIFTFMGSWNDFLGPLVFLNSQVKFTVPLMIASFQGLYSTNWSLLMAAASIALIPVLIIYISAQRYFIQGITLTGMKA